MFIWDSVAYSCWAGSRNAKRAALMPRLYKHGLLAVLLLVVTSLVVSCHREELKLGSNQYALTGTCNKLGLNINQPVLVGGPNLGTSNVTACDDPEELCDGANIKKTGVHNLRIDVDLFPWELDMNTPIPPDDRWQGEYRSIVGVLNDINRALTLNLALGNKAIILDDDLLQSPRSACGSCDDQTEWLAEYKRRFADVVALFVCEMAVDQPPVTIRQLEVFPDPDADLSGSPLIHPSWFKEILMTISDYRERARNGDSGFEFADTTVSCSGVSSSEIETRWRNMWGADNLELVAGSTKSLGYLDSLFLELELSNVNSLGAALDAIKIDRLGIDLRNDQAFSSARHADTTLTNLESILTDNYAQSPPPSATFVTEGKLVVTAYGKDPQDGDDIVGVVGGTGEYVGFKNDKRVTQTFLSSLRDETSGALVGIFATDRSEKSDILTSVQGEVCKSRSDFVFVIDTTSSMREEIEFVRQRAEDITKKIFADPNLNAQVALIQYRDFPYLNFGESTDFPCNRVSNFVAKDGEAGLIELIRGLEERSGADNRESVYSALMAAVDPDHHQCILGNRPECLPANPPQNVPERVGLPAPGAEDCQPIDLWRSDLPDDPVSRNVILMGDAPPHGEDSPGEPLEEVEPFTGYTRCQVIERANAQQGELLDEHNCIEFEPEFCPCPYDEIPDDPTIGIPTDLCPLPDPFSTSACSDESFSTPASKNVAAEFENTAGTGVKIFAVQVVECDPFGCTPGYPSFEELAEGTGGQSYDSAADDPQFVDDLIRVIDDIIMSSNSPPVTDNATASLEVLWPPNHRMVTVRVLGVFDPRQRPREYHGHEHYAG